MPPSSKMDFGGIFLSGWGSSYIPCKKHCIVSCCSIVALEYRIRILYEVGIS